MQEFCLEEKGFITVELPPDPEATHEVCKSTARPITAIMDLVDNSVAAKAKNIYIEFLNENGTMETQKEYGGSNELDSINIIDDGCGMSLNELQKAMQIGGSKDGKNHHSKSKWATGLKTSGAFLGNKLTIVTKKQDPTNGDIKYAQAIYDIKFMNKVGKWCVSFTDQLDFVDQLLKERLDQKVGNSGTIVNISDLTSGSYSQIASARMSVIGGKKRNPLGIRYGSLMTEGVKKNRINISVNSEKVVGEDIFQRNSSTILTFRQKEQYSGVSYRITASLLDPAADGVNTALDRTGIFVERNGIVLANVGLMRKKHGYGDRTNHLVIKLEVDGRFDEFLTPDISKNKVRWDEDFSNHFFDTDVWKDVLNPTIEKRKKEEAVAKAKLNKQKADQHFKNITKLVAGSSGNLGVEPDKVISLRLDQNSRLSKGKDFDYEKETHCLWFGEDTDINRTLGSRSEEVKALFYSVFSSYMDFQELSMEKEEDVEQTYNFLSQTMQFFSQISQ